MVNHTHAKIPYPPNIQLIVIYGIWFEYSNLDIRILNI